MICISVKEDLLQKVVVAKLPHVISVIIALYQFSSVRNSLFIHNLSVIEGGVDAPGILLFDLKSF